MLDAAFFRKMNPNYARPQPKELVKKRTEDDGYLKMYLEPSKKRTLDQIKDNGMEPTEIEELLSDYSRLRSGGQVVEYDADPFPVAVKLT